MKRSTLLIPLSLLLFNTCVSAQQYAGQSYANSMPTVPGSQITYWNVLDANGGNTSLLNYMILPNGNQQDPSQVQRAVIVIHGLGRDPQTYMSNMLTALRTTTQSDSSVNPTNVAVVAPYFPNGDDKNTGYPWSSSNVSTSSALVWRGSRWANGEDNQYPTGQSTVSSYSVVDQMIEYFDNSAIYPNMKQIVIAGHSLGAQFVNRYAAVGNNLGTTAPVSYWVGNPNNWLWFNSSRPIPAPSCSTYDTWRDGLSNYTVQYGASLASNPSNVLSNYNSRRVTMARGLQDSGDDSSGCSPALTGVNRAERFYNSLVWFPPSSTANVDYIAGVGHDSGQMFSSAAGTTRLFLDNFNGDGSRHLDFGPRQQAGDSPNPNPSNTAAPAIIGRGASGMTYQGCWSDAAPSKALSYTAYQGRSNATVETCTAACAAAGYTVAGMEYGNECYCDNGMPSTSWPVGDTSCSMACAGNSAQDCGAGSRLSVWSATTPTRYAAPSVLASTGAFTSMGCYTDAQTNRTLATISTYSSSMTIQSCAAFCNAYTYMGTTYGSECYCSNTIGGPGAPAANQNDCNSMTCSGNKYQYCGAGSRLLLYKQTLPTTTSSSSTSTTSSSTTSTTSKPTTTSTSMTSTKMTTTTSSAAPKATPSLLTVKKTGKWTFSDCIVYNSKAPSLSTHLTVKNITPEKCLAACVTANLPYCGVGVNNQCYGSKKIPKISSAPAVGGNTTPVARGCSMPCTGNSSVACGGAKRLNYYTYNKKATNVSPSLVQ